MTTDVGAGLWRVIVPAKGLALGKSRLAALGDSARRSLALAFAHDVVSAALSCPSVGRVIVVTSDEQVAAALSCLGADLLS